MATLSTDAPSRDEISARLTMDVIDEIERRLRADGYGDGDRIRIALLHIDAIKTGKATTLRPAPSAEDLESALHTAMADEAMLEQRAGKPEIIAESVAEDVLPALARDLFDAGVRLSGPRPAIELGPSFYEMQATRDELQRQGDGWRNLRIDGSYM